MKYICFILFGFLIAISIFSVPAVERGRYLKLNDSLPNLNAGGCGYFAYKLYQRLDKDRYTLVMIEGGKHIMIRDNFKGAYVDSHGYHTLVDVQMNWGPRIEWITEDSLRMLLDDTSCWNPTFRKKDTTVIIQFINNL